MCERYVIPEQLEAEREFRPRSPWWKFAASFNVAPSRNVPVIRLHESDREGVMLRWGLIPQWAEGDASKCNVVQAPALQIDSAEALRGAWFRNQRCILPVSGFYHWRLTAARYRQPFFIRLADQSCFGIAAIWDRTVNEDADDVLESCAPITVSGGVGERFAHMPAVLRSEDYDTWLHGTVSAAKSLLRIRPQPRMIAHPVSPRINALKYDDPQLVQAVEPVEPAIRCA